MADFELDDSHLINAGIDPKDAGDTNADDQTLQQQEPKIEGGDNSETQPAASTQNKVEGDAGKDSTSGAKDSGKEPGKKDQGQGTSDPELKAGDIRLNDGTIVRAGAERRHYENARLFRSENIDLKNQLNTSNQKYQTLEAKFNTLNDTVKQIGFEDPTRVTAAVRLYKDLAANPVQTMTKLLAELKGAGHSFDGIGGAVDTLAIQNAIEERLPSRSEPQQTPEQIARQAQEDGAREATEFLQAFPDAAIHEDIIANILQAEFAAGREPALREVYFKLRQSAINNGLDWNSPLGPQIEARKQAATQQPTTPTKPIVNGRGGPVGQHSEHIDPMKAGNGESKDDLILAAMAENGYTYTR